MVPRALGPAGGVTTEVNTKNQINNSGFAYDAAGNLTAHGSLTMTYDAENRMLSTNAGVGYTYDGDGKRVAKSNGKLYWYGMSGLDALVETDGAGNNPTEYVFFGGQRIARRDPSGSVFYYFSNHLGSASVITSSAGSIVEESDYYPFGGERIVVNNDPNPYKFTGKERDGESGLDYFGARYYSSALGRFSSADPLLITRERMRDPQNLNLYSYVRNNPLKYIDPNGEDLIIYLFYDKNLTEEQKKYLQANMKQIQAAIAEKFKKAGVEKVEFRDGSKLTQKQIDKILKMGGTPNTTGIGLLNFADKSFGGYTSGQDTRGATSSDNRSVVFLGRLQTGLKPDDADTLNFRVGEVGAHELGHGQRFESDGETLNFIKELFRRGNLMGEGQGMPNAERPKQFDPKQDRTQKAIREINRIGDNTPKP